MDKKAKIFRTFGIIAIIVVCMFLLGGCSGNRKLQAELDRVSAKLELAEHCLSDIEDYFVPIDHYYTMVNPEYDEDEVESAVVSIESVLCEWRTGK